MDQIQFPNYRKPDQTVSLEKFQALLARVEALEKASHKDEGKDSLIDQAVELGIGPKSTLSRWSVDKLTAEIDKAK